MAKLTLLHIDYDWWIRDGEELYGPYKTKKEADEDRKGLQQFYRHESTPGYVSIESEDLCDES